ncbi:type II secretion system protein [Rheinheimera maricola]|uniref:Type II secretion system GspH family protein n=1 Tax=Rheinheimera maricola TaxID=2793282 RepID=A0ABS7XBI7_9GAMM|nr:type II secretion system protein [Rheinheimera maricola]MBZ9612539.1 type II secretion system GspH family protein [Rheinheimera maricola]
MNKASGMVLIMVLVYLLIISLLISAMLVVSQLSHKAANAGQQQLQITYQALIQHNSAIASVSDAAIDVEPLAVCPAAYAAWSENTVQCAMLHLQTETFSTNRHFYAGYNSLLLKQTLNGEPD